MSTVRRIRIFGVVAMATGLFLLPAAADASPPTDDGHKVTICHRTNAVDNPYTVNEVDIASVDGSLGQGEGDHTLHVGDVFDFDADFDVVYPTPRNGDQWGDIIPPFDYDGGSYPGLNWTEEGQAIHAAGCQQPPPPPETTLTVTKVVDGDAAPAEWEFQFLTGAGDFVLSHGAPTNGPLDVEPDVAVAVAEESNAGATSTSIECTDAVVEPGGNDLEVLVTVAEGDAAVCTFTNTYEPEVVVETGSITVTKVVTGDAPDTWSFPFDAGTLGSDDLTHDDATTVFEGAAEGVHVIEETDAGDADLASIDCGDADVVVDIAEDKSSGTATVTLGEGEDVACTFTNDFGEVLDNTVVRTPSTEPEVLGSVVQAPTLPRTGAGSTVVAAIGALLLSAGATMTFGARHLEATLVRRQRL